MDSLLDAAQENRAVTSSLPLLWKISRGYLPFNRDSAKLYAETGMNQARSLSDSLWIAKFSLQISEVFYKTGDYEKAKKYCETALPIFQSLNAPAEIARSYSQLGKILIFSGDFPKAESFFQQSIKICEQTGDKNNLALTYSFYAFLHYFQHDFRQALDLYDKSQHLFSQLNEPDLPAFASNANFIGSIHFYYGDMFKALEAYQESFATFAKIEHQEGIAYALNNIGLVYQEVEYFDEALVHHLKALEIRKEIKDSLGIAYSLFDIGKFYKKQNQSGKALESYLEGLSICQLIGADGFINDYYTSLAEIYAEKGEIATSRKYLAQLKQPENPPNEAKLILAKLLILEKKWKEAIPVALGVFNAPDADNFIKLKNESSGYLIASYRALGQYRKALEFSLIKQALTDSLNNLQNAKLTRRLAFEFESERKEAELESLTRQNQLQKAQMEKQRYLLYAILLLGLVAILTALGFYVISKKNKQLAEKETQLRNSTLNLFANISHELRTPLSILRIPLEQMQQGRFNGDIAKTRAVMLKNVQRLTDLVNQILDIARTKESQLKLHLQYEDPIEFLRVFVGQFGSFASYKNLDLELVLPSRSLSIHFDEEIWSKILNNLINNALKFTEKGKVCIEFKYLKEKVEFKITDTGKGIPAEYLPHIFKRYYRSPMEVHQNFTGGLGLSLVKELVGLYKGTVEVESEIGKGTAFTIRLPHKEHFGKEEIPTEFEVLNLNLAPQKQGANLESQNLLPVSASPVFAMPNRENGKLKKVLIIEDNIELNGMIANYLSGRFSVYQAFDGVEGFEVAQKVVPDLILTDVVMPKMDGINLSQKLHTSTETSHIPLIIISALKDEYLDKGFWKAGVVDFIQKPLDMERLFSKINNLVNSREQFKSLIQKNGWIQITDDLPVADGDQDFLERMQKVLMENMDEEAFDIDKLSQLMLVSRMQLYRKVKSLTGMTPGKLIQKVKMQYAYELLLNGKCKNVTEVAGSIGYANLSFFSRKFKEVHQVNATDVLKMGEKAKKDIC